MSKVQLPDEVVEYANEFYQFDDRWVINNYFCFNTEYFDHTIFFSDLPDDERKLDRIRHMFSLAHSATKLFEVDVFETIHEAAVIMVTKHGEFIPVNKIFFDAVPDGFSLFAAEYSSSGYAIFAKDDSDSVCCSFMQLIQTIITQWQESE